MKYIILFVGAMCCLQLVAQQQSTPNVIFMVGDGMGLSQVSSAYYYGEQEPNFSRFKQIGFIKTSSSSHKVTDSAAGATAFACGQKTYNGAIGKDSLKQDIPNIIENLADKCVDCKTGLIATSSITHATPASFFAHADFRYEQEVIASQLHNSAVDYFAGGGQKFFEQRADNANYKDTLEAHGFKIEEGEFEAPRLSANEKFGFFGAEDGMPKMIEGRGDFLSQAAVHAIDYLNGDQPFFMMVEGSQIDWGGHANDSQYLIGEVLDFDKTIGKVLDFALADGNTLVIVTADHETGGFTLSKAADLPEYKDVKMEIKGIKPTFSTGGHSGTLVPVFAFGPGAEKFQGIYENTELFNKMQQALGLTD